MRAVVSTFEDADGVVQKTFFSEYLTCGLAEAHGASRRLIQTAMLRGDPADMVRIFDEADREVVRWNIVQEVSLLASERSVPSFARS